MKRSLPKSILIGSFAAVSILSPLLASAQTDQTASVVPAGSHISAVISSWFNPLLWFTHGASDPSVVQAAQKAPADSEAFQADSGIYTTPLAPDAGGDLNIDAVAATTTGVTTTTTKIVPGKIATTSYSISVDNHVVIPAEKPKIDNSLTITGPKTMNAGTQGTWTLGGGLVESPDTTYSVDWGDTAPMEAMALMPSLPVFTPAHIFEHSYADAGTYLITFMAVNDEGISTTTSTIVKVSATSADAK